MRIARYLAPTGGGAAVGIIQDGTIAEVPASGGELGPLLLLDRPGLEQVASAAIVRHKIADVRLLAPIGRPGKILALAGNMHAPDKRRNIDVDKDAPQYFIKPYSALIGHDDVIPAHEVTDKMIDEIELGVVIGRPGFRIPRERAYDHVFGYTVMNDFSARKLAYADEGSMSTRQGFFAWLNGKWLDGYCPVGPWIVHRSALPDIGNLKVTTKLNGKVVLDYTTADIIFDVPRLVAFISRMCTLEPGDLIALGVSPGPATAPDREVLPGDTVEGTIQGIGTLRNKIAKR